MVQRPGCPAHSLGQSQIVCGGFDEAFRVLGISAAIAFVPDLALLGPQPLPWGPIKLEKGCYPPIGRKGDPYWPTDSLAIGSGLAAGGTTRVREACCG